MQTFRADSATFTTTSFESHQRLKVEGAWKPEARSLVPGALFVPCFRHKESSPAGIPGTPNEATPTA